MYNHLTLSYLTVISPAYNEVFISSVHREPAAQCLHHHVPSAQNRGIKHTLFSTFTSWPKPDRKSWISANHLQTWSTYRRGFGDVAPAWVLIIRHKTKTSFNSAPHCLTFTKHHISDTSPDLNILDQKYRLSVIAKSSTFFMGSK